MPFQPRDFCFPSIIDARAYSEAKAITSGLRLVARLH